MDYQISMQEVMDNLISFKERLLAGFKEKKTDQRKYKALVNRSTGKIRFAQKMSAFEPHISGITGRKDEPGDLLEIYLTVSKGENGGHFEALNKQGQPIKRGDITPYAQRVLNEMVTILNAKAKFFKRDLGEMLIEEVILDDLSSIQLTPQEVQIEDLPGWMGSLNRIDAEKILSGRPLGTYLFRFGDEIALLSTFHFAEENFLSVYPYLITVVEEDDKISDILLLQTNKGWVCYHDDPDLKDPSYQFFSSLPDLLVTLKTKASTPLSY